MNTSQSLRKKASKTITSTATTSTLEKTPAVSQSTKKRRARNTPTRNFLWVERTLKDSSDCLCEICASV